MSESERTKVEDGAPEYKDDGPAPLEDACGIPIEWKPGCHGYVGGGYTGQYCGRPLCGQRKTWSALPWGAALLQTAAVLPLLPAALPEFIMVPLKVGG